MWSFALTAFVIIMMIGGALMGVICILLASSTSMKKSTAFAWGTVFGPVGISAMLLKVTRRSTLANGSSSDDGEGISYTIGLVGAGMISASLAMPWFRATGFEKQLSLVPLTTPVLRDPSILLLLVTLAGALMAIVKRYVTLLGWAGALMFSVSLIIWFMGSRLIAFLPIDIVPVDAAITLGRGSSFCLFGAILVLLSSFSTLVEETWPGRVSFPSTSTLVIGLGVTGLVVFVRDITWVRFDTAGLSWGLPADGIPFVGDLLVLLLVLGAVSAGISIFYSAKWLQIVCVCCGSLIIAASLLSVVFAEVIDRSLDWLRGQSSSFAGADIDTSITRGPYFTAAVGMALVIFGFVNRSGSRPPDPARRSSGLTQTVSIAPPDPF